MIVVAKDDVAALHDRTARARAHAIVHVDERDAIEITCGIVLSSDAAWVKRIGPVILTRVKTKGRICGLS
jgi:hypothetical protein